MSSYYEFMCMKSHLWILICSEFIYLWIHIWIQNLYIWIHKHEFMYSWIHMIIHIYINIAYECIWSFHIWIHMHMNSHELWIHHDHSKIFSYMNSYISWIHTWIGVYKGSRWSALSLIEASCGSKEEVEKRSLWFFWRALPGVLVEWLLTASGRRMTAALPSPGSLGIRVLQTWMQVTHCFLKNSGKIYFWQATVSPQMEKGICSNKMKFPGDLRH